MNKRILLIIYISILLYQEKYNFYYPTLPVYPNNRNELSLVKDMIKNRNKKDVDDFKKTDISVCFLFSEETKETVQELRNITSSTKVLFLIKFFKNVINRARPYQIDPMINNLKSLTSHTPAYPAGHAFQAYYLAKILSIKYPDKKEKWYRIAKTCDIIRVKAGLHYPSDGQFSEQLVNYFFDFLWDSK